VVSDSDAWDYLTLDEDDVTEYVAECYWLGTGQTGLRYRSRRRLAEQVARAATGEHGP
jgi:hypothetical protein